MTQYGCKSRPDSPPDPLVNDKKKKAKPVAKEVLLVWKGTQSLKSPDHQTYSSLSTPDGEMLANPQGVTYTTGVFVKVKNGKWKKKYEHKGIMIGGKKGNWRIVKTPMKVEQMNIPCLSRDQLPDGDPEKPPENCQYTHIVDVEAWSFKQKKTGKTHQLFTPTDTPDDELDSNVLILGSYGETVSYQVCLLSGGSAGLGDLSCTWHLLDLQTGKRFTSKDFPKLDDQKDTPSLLTRIKKRIKEQDPDGNWDCPIPDSLLGLARVVPFWDKKGKPLYRAVYSYRTTVSCQNDGWDNEQSTISNVRQASWAQPSIRKGFNPMPSEVVRYWEQAPFMGSSEVQEISHKGERDATQ